MGGEGESACLRSLLRLKLSIDDFSTEILVPLKERPLRLSRLSASLSRSTRTNTSLLKFPFLSAMRKILSRELTRALQFF